MLRSLAKWSCLGLLVALCLVLSPVSTLAQDEIGASGNGGTADCSANGGAVAAGDVNSGANTGAAIGVGDTWGDVAVDGGATANSTDFAVGADGGTGICDASGGDENDAFLIDRIFVPAPEPGPEPPAPEPPAPEPPDDEFQVCVQLGESGTPVCNPGSCTGPASAADCTVPEGCASIDPSFEDPCQFVGCEVSGNTGFCLVLPG